MVLEFPEISSALILAPHPDDEALGCSGTVALLNQKGASTTVVFLTNGERLHGEPSAAIAEKRKDEAKSASEILGCKEPISLGFPDGEINIYTEGVYEKLFDIIEKTKPDIIFSPSPIDYHQDHIATSKIAIRLLRTLNSFKLAFYEIYSTLRFNHLVDITDVLEQKKKAILNYTTSLYGKPEVYVHASLGLNAQRSIFVQKSGYYEAFYIIETANDTEKIYDFLCYKDINK